jgi:hypothetical protein
MVDSNQGNDLAKERQNDQQNVQLSSGAEQIDHRPSNIDHQTTPV